MSEHGVVQTQADVRLDDVMLNSPVPAIHFQTASFGDGSILLAGSTTYGVGTLLAYNATLKKYVPYDKDDAASSVPNAVLMNEIVTNSAGDYQGTLAKGVVRFSRLKRGVGSIGALFDFTTLPPSAIAVARDNGLFIQRGV